MLVFILFLEVPGSNISFEGYREFTKHDLLGGLDHKIRLEGRDGELWVDGGVAIKVGSLDVTCDRVGGRLELSI